MQNSKLNDTEYRNLARARSRWNTMRQRCYNPKHPKYKDYGGRGIKVCDEWNDFDRFYKDIGDAPAPDLSMDRRDNSLGYFKENVRWSTQSEQMKNRRPYTRKATTPGRKSNAHLQIRGDNGLLMQTVEAAKKLGCSTETLRRRLRMRGKRHPEFKEVLLSELKRLSRKHT